jgi:hypothetical protein
MSIFKERSAFLVAGQRSFSDALLIGVMFGTLVPIAVDAFARRRADTASRCQNSLLRAGVES